MPAFLLLLQLGFRGQRLAVERVAAEAELGSADEELVLVSAPDHQAGIYVPFQRVALGHPMPRSWRVLSLARHDHVLRRTGPDELELEVVGGRMMESMFEQVYRASRFPLPPGTAIDAGLFQVEVREGDGTGPTRVAFRFRRPLAEVRFLHWKDSRLRRLELPEVGASVRLPWSVGPLGL
jgi:hypothetical protein